MVGPQPDAGGCASRRLSLKRLGRFGLAGWLPAPAQWARTGGLAGVGPAATGMLGLALWATPARVRAGAQLEEPLADAVRLALSAAVADKAPPRPQFADTDRRLAYLRWLSDSSERLRKRMTEGVTRVEFLEAVWYESKRAGLEPALVLGLIQVESGFRKYAISTAGARGYMQVMPFWARLIGDGDPARLFHTQTNLRFGCVILRHYLDMEKGDLFLALGRYNGSRGKAPYPQAVLASKRLWDHPSD
jgi:soluble lytic murein transglycosylase-like protein